MLTALLIANLLIVAFCIKQIADLRAQIADLLEPYLFAEEVEDESFSDAEETESPESVGVSDHIIKRNEEYDQRIAELRAELAQHAPQRPASNDAEILHPGIENLPHDSVKDYQTNPPVIEYTD